MFSATPKQVGAAGDEGVDPAEFQRYFVKQGRFTAGTETRYAPSAIIAPPTHQHLATGFPLGMRFHSAPVIRLADAKPIQLGHTVKADGRWRLFLFADAGDPAAPASRLRSTCTFLAEAPASPLRFHSPVSAHPDGVIDVRAVFQQGHHTLALSAMPALLLPRKGRHGLVDYEKMFCPDPRAGDIFDRRGIEREAGCIVIVRPDQYVANVLPLDAHDEITAFFRGLVQ